MSKQLDLTGQRYGMLTAITPVTETILGRQYHTAWLCRCDCGNMVQVPTQRLRSGDKYSCGCVNRRNATEKYYATHRTHGGSGTKLYHIYRSMLRRCYNPKDAFYSIYGGRGITVCDEWRDNYTAFQIWAHENGYDETAPTGKCTIDRIDVNKGYSPSNCRWVDAKAQQHNRTDTLYLTLHGIRKPLIEWAEEKGAPPYSTMRYRKHQGWSDEEVFYGRSRYARHSNDRQG